MTIAEKLTAIAENEQKVFEAGKKDLVSKLDSLSYFFNSNTNTDILSAILNADLSHIKRAQYMFIDNSVITEFVVPETLNPILIHGMFQRCTSVFQVSGLDKMNRTSAISDVFNGCTALVDAGTIDFTNVTYASRTFQDCTSLANIQAVGTIAIGIDLHWSPLTHDSLMSIIDHLQTKSSGSFVLTLGTDNLAKLTDAEKAIATEKGWTLA